MASGVYQFGMLPDQTNDEVLYQRDGKTATVSITRNLPYMSIKTNGKSDAGLQITGKGHSKDEETMVLAGAIGIIHRPEARTAAIIGWGSGLTTHTLLTVPQISSVDTIEIEPVMIKAAMLFGPRVRLAYEDPRSHVRIEDAKSYFSFHNKKYDLIISEPSNPWVSGVASLFTKEFYSQVRGYLTNDGLFVQWIHLYDIDMPLVASIMKALTPYFSDYIIYSTNSYDMLIVACPVGEIQEPHASFLTMKDLMHELNKIDVMGLPDINVRVLGNRATLSPLFESYSMSANSDYAPVVDLYAVKSRFFDLTASPQLHSIEFGRLPIMQMLGKRRADISASPVAYSTFPKSIRVHFSNMIYQYFMDDQLKWSHPYAPLRDQSRQTVMNAKQVLTRKCSEDNFRQDWWMAMLHIVADFVPCWSPEQLSRFCTASKHHRVRNTFPIRSVTSLDSSRLLGEKTPCVCLITRENSWHKQGNMP